MKKITIFALILSVFGALNAGFWGWFQFDIVAWLCHGNTNWTARFVYAIIGFSSLWSLRFYWFLKIRSTFLKENIN
ncbi:MAG: DUF378 domain-containing protein [Chlamydiales bacterium]|nr:DUF378 domain-containing protein [Chlamydiales bacterium]